MHAYAGRAYICRMYAPSMLFPPTQNVDTIFSYINVYGLTTHVEQVSVYQPKLDFACRTAPLPSKTHEAKLKTSA